MTRTTSLTALFLAIAGVFAVNAWVMPLPGMGWARSGDGSETATEARGGAGGGGSGGGRRGGRGGDNGPAPVAVAPASIADVPVYLRAVGTAKAQATVTVRAQVEGKLIKVHFKEGQDVKRGDLLAEIDPITYRAQLDQALAKRKLTQVQLDNAEADLERVTKVGPGVVTQKSVDTQRALVAQYEAQLKSDAAAVANAEAVLGYTRITSPIDGRTGQRLVDEGNLIRSADAGIVTIAQIRPISVQFTMPQQQLSDVNAAMTRGPVAVEALASDDRTAIDSGALMFIDNQIDQTTGTVRMKADLPNEQLQLWPGQFANVRVLIDTLKQAVTVPTAAVQRGPSGTFVYVVANEGAPTVKMRRVLVAQQTEAVAVIREGLAAKEQVVTSGFARLKDGGAVSISATAPATGPEGPGGEAGAAKTADPAKTSSGPAATEGDGQPKRGERRRRAEGDGRSGQRATSTVVQ